MSDVKAKTLWELTALPGLGGFKGPTSKGGKGWEMEMEGEEREWQGKEEKGTLRVVYTPMSKILKNTLIAELIWLAGAATQAFATGGKYPRAVTVCSTPCMRQIFNQQLKRTEKVLKVLGLNVKVKVIENPLTASKFKVF